MKFNWGSAIDTVREGLGPVYLHSNILPVVRLDSDEGGSSPAVDTAMRFIQPMVVAETIAGPLRMAPAGQPKTPGAWFPVVVGGAVAVASLAILSTGVLLGQGYKTAVPLVLSGGLGVLAGQAAKASVKQAAR